MAASVLYMSKLAWYDPRSILAQGYLGIGPRWRVRKDVTLADARERKTTLDRNGFELAAFEPITASPKETWLDPFSVSDKLFPAAQRLLETRFPGSKALVFDHIVRGAKSDKLASGPVAFVHNDYSLQSGAPRVRSLLKDFATSETQLEAVTSARVAIVNLWCPLVPVERDPLAFVDWTTTKPEDLIVVKIQYADRAGETSVVYPSQQHEWFSYSDMVPGEAVLLKTWDSPDADDPQKARFAIHSSATLHFPEDDASDVFCGLLGGVGGGQDEKTSARRVRPTRESIELRAMVLFHPDASDPGFLKKDFVAPHIARLRNKNDSSGFEKRISTELVDENPLAFVPVSSGTAE